MNPMCPYCGMPSRLVDSKAIYGRSYGSAYLCKPCGAYVGCHKGTNRPLGTLANAELRAARQAAHAAFDPLWKGGAWSRTEAYKWLACRMGIKLRRCHIGQFNADQCRQVLTICRQEQL